MPLYDYRCSQCGLQVEVMHGIYEPGPTACSACGGAMRKALSPPAIHFKGSGWAKKDAATSRQPTPSGSAPASPASTKAAEAKAGDTSASSDGTRTASGSTDSGTKGAPAATGTAD